MAERHFVSTTPPAVGVAGVLRRRLPAGRVVTDPDIVAGLSHDQAVWAPVGRAVAVVRAKSTDEVRTVVRACLEQGVPLVARGAGTGLSGGANAVEGGVILALDGMDQVLEVDELERLAVVQPGVVNDDLRAQVAALGLWYPPDPASSPWSTIGGNVATNAGGVCCVKYGVTRDHVLGLEVVTGTGEVVRAAVHEQLSVEEAARGQAQEVGRHEGRAEAYREAAGLVHDVMAALRLDWHQCMRSDVRPRRWCWALGMLLGRVTR